MQHKAPIYDGGEGAEHGVQGRARTQEVGGMDEWAMLAVCRVASTWMSCLTTQLEQQRGRKSAWVLVGNGLRARKRRTLQAGTYVARLK